MILIIAPRRDPVASDGERWLRAAHVPVVRVDSQRLVSAGRIALRWDDRGRPRRTLAHDDIAIDLDDVGAVWHRRALFGPNPAIGDARARVFAQRESEQVLKQMWSDLQVPFVPAPWSVLVDRQTKLRQLTLAGRLGFAVPPTLVTNDPGEFLAFYRQQRGRCITKHLGTASLAESGLADTFCRYTEPVTRADLRSLGSLRLCPVLVQGYVPKRIELRVTVVGERVFAAAIHSQVAAHGAHDWRRDHRVPCLVHALPDDVARRCVRLTSELGLRYGAIDLILTPDGQYVFLEINAAREYHWIEAFTGMPITRAICELLISLAQDHCERASA
jgi:hypothetical protein